MAETLEVARGNYLRPNGHGGYIIRQSDLSSWSRCQLQKFYYDRAANDPDAPQPASLSATVYGTVVHYALQVLETGMHEGDPDALERALSTFRHFWTHPEQLGERITEWLPRQTWGGLKQRGQIAIRDHHKLLLGDDSLLMALEYQFAVPLLLDGRLHTVTGTIDRLSVKRWNRKPYISLDDNKTGKQPTYLRWNMQGSVYAWASTLTEFWSGWPDSGMGELATFDPDTILKLEESFSSHGYRLVEDSPDHIYPLAARRFRWINLQDIKFADGGWRHERDYARAHLAIDAYIRACEAEVYSVNTTGEVCRYCPFRKTCGGIGLPDEDEGTP